MREFRSGSQILFGYLPEQTVDLAGKVWKVSAWNQPSAEPIDDQSLRDELIRQAAIWEANGVDGGYVDELRRRSSVRVFSLNHGRGVTVEPFPKIWICRNSACRTVSDSPNPPCSVCGSRTPLGQFHFVGYHDCGVLKTPWLKKCPTHNKVCVRFPGTSSANEILFECPICNRQLQKGLGFRKCECGNGNISYTVHRAAAVYCPRGIVVVNPPTPQRIKELRDSGGPTRALEWVVNGMPTRSVREVGRSKGAFLQSLLDQGFDPTVAEAMARLAEQSGQFQESSTSTLSLPSFVRADAESQAVSIAMATYDSRLMLQDMAQGSSHNSEVSELYSVKYPAAVGAGHIESVELIDRFPVLTGQFGYTRGNSAPGTSRLVAYRIGGEYVVYGDVAQTEALFVRLKPQTVARWLERQGFVLTPWNDDRSARLAILSAVIMPSPGSDPPPNPTPGSALLTLIHSYCHRFIRSAAVLAGVDRNSLSEYLVPLHLGFFVFAAARGGFVLGGLQAMFETELDRLLSEVVYGEHRCALDPGCERSGSACVACLHLGEPSCRWFNRYLDRASLFGVKGYF